MATEASDFFSHREHRELKILATENTEDTEKKGLEIKRRECQYGIYISISRPIKSQW
jgi:hypothetical protein